VRSANIIEAVTTAVAGTPTARAGIEEIFLTRTQLARRHQTTIFTIIHREQAGLLKPLKLGRHVRYRLSDVLAFEKAGENRFAKKEVK
jgi:predicted unusual protein kinase regulating ubiquinone biosynthesis (AarF/ABC1/UbiB family)